MSERPANFVTVARAFRAPVSGGVAPIDRDVGTGEVPVVTLVEGRSPSPLAGFKDERGRHSRRFMSSEVEGLEAVG